MDLFIEIAKIVLPAGMVLYAVYLIVKSFIYKEIEKAKLEVRSRSIETVLPNRLHAFERIVLFLERIHPQNLVMRLNYESYSAIEFHHILLNEIRNEYNHNVSQQVYMSDDVWEIIRTAKEELILNINNAASTMKEEATGAELGKAILEISIQNEVDLIANALRSVKAEIQQTF